MRRVNELLREVIAEEVTELKDPGLGFLTITAVDTSPDLRSAVVYYSVLGSEEEQQATSDALARAARHIQTAVGHQVRIKYTPVLEFRRDEALERGLRISRLLHELAEEEAGRQAAEAEPPIGSEEPDGA
jgi:ribosome-binding factor A